MKKIAFLSLFLSSCFAAFIFAGELSPNRVKAAEEIRCGNLIYAGSKSSVCFADKFLSLVSLQTNLKVARSFRDVKLSSKTLFNTPFCVFSGEGSFSLPKKEANNLRQYLKQGGFILASPSCSNEDWDKSFKNMVSSVFPKSKLEIIPMDHEIFSLVNKVKSLHLKTGGTAKLQGLYLDGRLVMIYSREGLNDVGNAKGCCCCGGNEIKESQQMNVNILTYSLLN